MYNLLKLIYYDSIVFFYMICHCLNWNSDYKTNKWEYQCYPKC